MGLDLLVAPLKLFMVGICWLLTEFHLVKHGKQVWLVFGGSQEILVIKQTDQTTMILAQEFLVFMGSKKWHGIGVIV